MTRVPSLTRVINRRFKQSSRLRRELSGTRNQLFDSCARGRLYRGSTKSNFDALDDRRTVQNWSRSIHIA